MHDGNIATTLAGQRFFLVGIGGSGMMPLAMILRGRGADVEGSDRGLDQGRVPAKFDALKALGIALHPQDGSGIVSADQVVVASAAVEETVADIVAANAHGCPRRTRAELNAQLFNGSATPIGIAGTSGKSTVTGMIGRILHACRRDPTVMNGAVMKDFASARAPFASALVGKGDAYVSEVDESDGSIALYVPRIAVVNNVSLDHKPVPELLQLFENFSNKAESVILNAEGEEAETLLNAIEPQRVRTFAIGKQADLVARDLAFSPFSVAFTLETEGRSVPVRLGVPGRHNVANALAAIGAARAAGVELDEAVEAIAGFTGLRRRFDLAGEANGVAVIDDFGHNPDKIAATLDTLHAFPGRVLALFQPHGYGPLRMMRCELVDALATRLRADDLLVLPDPVYQGGTVTREVTSADIVADLAAKGAPARHIADRAAAARALVDAARPGDRIVVMGARDDTLSQLAAEMVAMLAARA